MEKLIELLNERIKEGWKPYGDDYSITKIDEIWKSDGLYFVSFVGEDYPGPVNLEHLLTKQAGLIQWLVENDKVGDNKNSDRYTMMKLMRAEINEGTEVFEGTERYEFVIMILSIQDEPIEFLIRILKNV